MAGLNLGCGKDWASYPEYDGVDNVDFGQKYIIDIEKDGLKGIGNGSIDKIMAFNILEHIDQPQVIFVMNECNRVLKENGIMDIKVPPADSPLEAFSDPTHKSWWTYKTFTKYYCGKSPRNADYGIKKWAMDNLDTSDSGELKVRLKK